MAVCQYCIGLCYCWLLVELVLNFTCDEHWNGNKLFT